MLTFSKTQKKKIQISEQKLLKRMQKRSKRILKI